MKSFVLLAAMLVLAVICAGCMDGDQGGGEGLEKKGEDLSGGVMQGVQKANAFLAFLSGIPGIGQFTAPAVGLLGVIGTVAGGINAFLARRRIRREQARALAAETGLKTIVTAVEPVSGIGKLITAEARKDGTGEVIKAAYEGNLVT